MTTTSPASNMRADSRGVSKPNQRMLAMDAQYLMSRAMIVRKRVDAVTPRGSSILFCGSMKSLASGIPSPRSSRGGIADPMISPLWLFSHIQRMACAVPAYLWALIRP